MLSGITLMPTTGAVAPSKGEQEWKSTFSHDDEIVQPGYHRLYLFFFSSRRRHTRCNCDWSSDVCSSDLHPFPPASGNEDIGRIGIGQGGLLVTPLQMAMVAAAVANGGALMKPHFTDKVVDQDGRTVKTIDRKRVVMDSGVVEVGVVTVSV